MFLFEIKELVLELELSCECWVNCNFRNIDDVAKLTLSWSLTS